MIPESPIQRILMKSEELRCLLAETCLDDRIKIKCIRINPSVVKELLNDEYFLSYMKFSFPNESILDSILGLNVTIDPSVDEIEWGVGYKDE